MPSYFRFSKQMYETQIKRLYLFITMTEK